MLRPPMVMNGATPSIPTLLLAAVAAAGGLTACEGPDEPEAETPASVPDTLVQEPGRENARAWCRALVRQEIDPHISLTFQEDAKVREMGSGRYEVEGQLVIRESNEEGRPRHSYACRVRFSEATGWTLEKLDIRSRPPA